MIEISCKINIGNYESIGITVTGDDRDTIINEIRDIGDQLAPDNEETKKTITRYINRVFGTPASEEPTPSPVTIPPEPTPPKASEKKNCEFEPASSYRKVCQVCNLPLSKADVDVCKLFFPQGVLKCKECRGGV